MAHDLVTELLQYSSLACFMPIWQLCANLLIPNCLRSNLSYSPLAALELYVKITNSPFCAPQLILFLKRKHRVERLNTISTTNNKIQNGIRNLPQFLSFSLTLHFYLYLEVYYIYIIYIIYIIKCNYLQFVSIKYTPRTKLRN